MKENNRKEQCRFTKSYKYKHKSRTKSIKHSSCDPPKNQLQPTVIGDSGPNLASLKVTMATEAVFSNNLCCCCCYCSNKKARAKRKKPPRLSSDLYAAILFIIIIMQQLPVHQAFCPFKCICNDQSLSANCTQVPAISIVPMTLNPLLKQLTLCQLPMFELSNSLSVYRQLEYLNLNSNQLRQIKYENFNFKPAPKSVLVAHSQVAPSTNINNQELNVNNEQLAKHIKQAIDKSVSGGSDGFSGGGTGNSAGLGSIGDHQSMSNSNLNSEDEIRFHLRELDLGDNKIEQLGSLSDVYSHIGSNREEDDSRGNSEEESGESSQYQYRQQQQQQQQHEPGRSSSKRLKSSDLERLAPFLTLTRLESLNLGGNKLSKLHEHVFLGLVHLKQLDLSRNQLEFVDKLAFVGLIELEVLKLNQNRLASHLHQLSLAYCRAPMNELRYLDMSDNHKQMIFQTIQQADPAAILLPNQMFICAPKLVSLHLDGLQLRHVQVNAFDNLQQLETLNLSRNYLEQVPSDSLSYSNSNLSSTLRQLDLSETLIEFVNAKSFGSLRSLQKLCMNSMERLVSFDLASLSIMSGRGKLEDYVEVFNTRQQQQNNNNNNNNNIEQLIKSNGEFKTALKGLLPEHLFERVAFNTTSTKNSLKSVVVFGDQISSEMQQPLNHQIINHQQPLLINDNLIELQLRQNSRLQSFHSSLANSNEYPKGRIKFSKLKLLDLAGAHELRELPLDKMIDLGQLYDNLRVDLSFVTKLNCSSCQLSWLVDAVRHQRVLAVQRAAVGAPPGGVEPPLSLQDNWTPVPFDPYNMRPFSSKVILVSADTTGCSWPFSMHLMQLLDLETSFAPLFGHCDPNNSPNQQQVQGGAFSDQQQQQQEATQQNNEQFPYLQRAFNLGELNITANQHGKTGGEIGDGQRSTTTTSIGQLVLVIILALVLISFGAKLVMTIVARQRRFDFKWRSASLANTGSISSPGSSTQNNAHSPADCSSSSILSTAVTIGGTGRLMYSEQEQQQYQKQQLRLGATSAAAGADQLIFQNGKGFISGSNNVGQIERAHRRGNLFSRIVERWSGNSWHPSQLGESTTGHHHYYYPNSSGSSSSSGGGGGGGGGVQRKIGGGGETHIIENVVYGGNKILANYPIGGNGAGEEWHHEERLVSAGKQQGQFLLQQQHVPPSLRQDHPMSSSSICTSTTTTTGLMLATAAAKSSGGCNFDVDGGANFIKPAYSQHHLSGDRPSSSRNGVVVVVAPERGGVTNSLRYVYANCQQPGSGEVVSGGGGRMMGQLEAEQQAKNQLIIEPTSCQQTSNRQHQQQMLVKQLEAIETDPHNSLSYSSLHSNTTLLANTCRSGSHSGSGQDGVAVVSSSIQAKHRQQNQLRYSSGSSTNDHDNQLPAHSQAHLQRQQRQQCSQTNYLSGASSSGGRHDHFQHNNGNLSPLGSSATSSIGSTSSSIAGVAMEIAPLGMRMGHGGEQATTTDDSLTTFLVDGHIYVTLDRPIKQQNGCDEYALYERPHYQQQQQNRHRFLEEDQNGFFEAAKGGVVQQPSNNSWLVEKREEDKNKDYKSFEWSSTMLGSQCHRPLGSQSTGGGATGLSGSLLQNTVDKFKLDQTQVLLDIQQQEHFASQLSKLSLPIGANNRPKQQLQPLTNNTATTASDVEQQQQRLRDILRIEDPSHRAVLPGLYGNGSAAEEKAVGMKLYDKNGSDFVVAKNRKQGSKKAKRKKRKASPEQAQCSPSGQAVRSTTTASENDNVTGYPDYDGNNGSTQPIVATTTTTTAAAASLGPIQLHNGTNSGQQLKGRHQKEKQQQQQLFMGLNSSNETTTANENGNAASSSMMDGGSDVTTTTTTTSKYDANHDDAICAQTTATTANSDGHNNNNMSQQAKCDDDYVINGLANFKRHHERNRNLNIIQNHLASVEQTKQQSGSKSLLAKRMGVSTSSVGNNTKSSQQAASKTHNANTNNEHSIMIGQQNFVVSSNNNDRPITTTATFGAPNLATTDGSKPNGFVGVDKDELSQLQLQLRKPSELDDSAQQQRSYTSISVIGPKRDLPAQSQCGSTTTTTTTLYNNGQQKFCDSVLQGQTMANKVAVAGGSSIISVPPLPLTPPDSSIYTTDDNNNKSSANSKRASIGKSPQVNGASSSNNEIYSNQFYYCKPSSATLSRVSPRSNEFGKLKLRNGDETNHHHHG